MQYPRPDAELRRLTTALCEGTIGPDGHKRLEKLLAEDPVARRFYYDYMAIHAELAWSNAAGDSQKTLLSLEGELLRHVRNKSTRTAGHITRETAREITRARFPQRLFPARL